MRDFVYARPDDLSEVFDLIGDRLPQQVRPMVGGTDLIVGMQAGALRPELVVDLKHVADLKPGVRLVDDTVVVPATTCLTDVFSSPVVRAHVPALSEAAAVVGSVQIRNRASLTGNICNASPAFDTGPPLLAYSAQIVLTSSGGDRRVPVAEFVLGPRRIDLRPGEIATAVEIPVPEEPVRATFARLTRRRGVDLATVNLCCAASPSRTRFAFGAVGPRPFVVEVETTELDGPGVTVTDRDEVLRSVIEHAAPITDVRASADYRRAMLMTMTRRALDSVLPPAQGG